ncbi:MAG: (Fe-S)-binding protein [Solirubrobacteraceae bacterium]
MTLATSDVVGILGDNLRLRGSVLPISARKATRWTRGLGLPHGGSTVLYTGQMYQLVPYIEKLVAAEERLGDSPLARLTGLGRHVNQVINISAFMGHPSSEEREHFDEVPRRIVRLLREAGVEFGCLYEHDLYSGALAYDLGLDDLVAKHARKVLEGLRTYGPVKELITIDPHTTNMLRTVYPKLLGEQWNFKVRSYLEVLAERQQAAETASGNGRPKSAVGGKLRQLALHDSCVYARHEGVIDQPRQLLANAGIEVLEPDRAGQLTWCCGGPAESLYPAKALAVGRKRVEQIQAVAPECVTMCPLCLVNLTKAAAGAVKFRDISEVLLEASERAEIGETPAEPAVLAH